MPSFIFPSKVSTSRTSEVLSPSYSVIVDLILAKFTNTLHGNEKNNFEISALHFLNDTINNNNKTTEHSVIVSLVEIISQELERKSSSLHISLQVDASGTLPNNTSFESLVSRKFASGDFSVIKHMFNDTFNHDSSKNFNSPAIPLLVTYFAVGIYLIIKIIQQRNHYRKFKALLEKEKEDEMNRCNVHPKTHPNDSLFQLDSKTLISIHNNQVFELSLK